MSGEEIDNLLSSIIIVLLIVVVWKWYQGSGKCGQDRMTLSCGCKNSKCKCQGVTRVSRRKLYQPDIREHMDGGFQKQYENKQIGTPGHEPKVIPIDDDYSGDTVQQMALEPEVLRSQQDYLDGLGFSGLPTGSSHETTLEETGRSAGTSNFVGLNQRKLCKSRQLVTMGPNARTVPSETNEEWCNIDENDLI
jgi:hypothetical protein